MVANHHRASTLQVCQCACSAHTLSAYIAYIHLTLPLTVVHVSALFAFPVHTLRTLCEHLLFACSHHCSCTLCMSTHCLHMPCTFCSSTVVPMHLYSSCAPNKSTHYPTLCLPLAHPSHVYQLFLPISCHSVACILHVYTLLTHLTLQLICAVPIWRVGDQHNPHPCAWVRLPCGCRYGLSADTQGWTLGGHYA